MHQASTWRPRATRATGAAIHFRDAAQRLGATAAQAQDLYPYAVALRQYETRLFRSIEIRPGSRPGHRRWIEQPRQLSIRRLA